MTTSTLSYLGQLRVEATHVKSNTSITTDAPTDNNGKGQTFSPTDMVATSLASCMMTIVGIKAEQNNIDITKLTADVTKIMASSPRKIQEIIVNLHFNNNSYSEKEKKLLINAAKTCPVALSLHPDIKQNLNFFF